MLKDEIYEFLRRSELFRSLDDNALKHAASYFTIKEFTKDTVIFSQGAIGDCFYIIRAGGVNAVTIKGGEEKIVNRLKSGECFGEMALLTGAPRSASIVATTDVKVYALSSDDFGSIIKMYPIISLNLSKVLSEKLTKAALGKTEEEHISETIVVYGVQGRIGKTTAAANLAVYLAQNTNKKIALLDFDLQFGDIAFMLDTHPKHTLYDLMTTEEIDSDLVEGNLTPYKNYDLKIMFPPERIEHAELIHEQKISTLFAFLKELYDTIIIDTSPNLSGITVTSLDMADLILFLVTPDLLILKNSKSCLELMERLQYPSDKIKIGLSQNFKMPQEMSSKEIEEFLKRKIDFFLPFDPAVAQSLAKGCPTSIYKPQSLLSQAIAKLAGSVSRTS